LTDAIATINKAYLSAKQQKKYMRFLFGGIAIFLVLAYIIGRIFTPSHAPMRKVFLKGMYLTGIGLLVLAAIVGLGAIINWGLGNYGTDVSGPFAGMSDERRVEYLDSLKQAVPAPEPDQLKTQFVNYDFQTSVLPCYETVHTFNVASLKEIVSLEKEDVIMADGIYEIITYGEFRTNKPEVGFHVQGTFSVQYRFFGGSRERDPGWSLTKILVSDCRVLSEKPKEEMEDNSRYYPDLDRTDEN
jgi:hypothetical protein